MIFLLFLFSVFLQANANDCDALFQPLDGAGKAGKVAYDGAIGAANGAITAGANYMNSLADGAIIDKAVKASTVGLKLASTFAGPLAGIGIGILTDAIFGDPNEKRFEQIEKNQQCMVQEMNKMKDDIAENARNIEVNTHNIAKNTAAINALNQAMSDFKSDMSRILTHDQANQIDQQDKNLEYLITDLLECLKTSSVITLEEQLARLLEADDSGYTRRNLASSFHWVQKKNQCDYGSTPSSTLWRQLQTAMDQIKPMFTKLEQMVGTPGHNNCYMKNGDTLLTIVSVTSKLQSAVTLFLLNVKMKGLLTLKTRKDMYFNKIPGIIDEAISAFKRLNAKVLQLQRIAMNGKMKETTGRLSFAFPCNGAKYQNRDSWDECKKKCWQSNNCYGMAHSGTSCHFWLTPTDFSEKNRRCAWQRTTKVAWKDVNYKLNPDNCKYVVAGADAFSGVLRSLEATKKLVNDVKTEYNGFFSSGETQRTHFEADGEEKWWVSLKTCPTPKCGQQYGVVKSRMPDQNYNPINIIGCKKTTNKHCHYRGYPGNYYRGYHGGWAESRLAKVLSKFTAALETEEDEE